jgi:ABC-type Fe3+-hydroxamate transport system substrate-binding protein
MFSEMKKGNIPSRKIRPVLIIMISVMILGFSFACKRTDKPVTEKRYVVLSPEIAEIIAVIEGTDNIVGVTEECTYPEALKTKTKVGKFGTLNKEAIIALKPSIVFASSLEQQSIAADLAKLGIKVRIIYPRTVAEMLLGIIDVGDAIGKGERAVFVADSLKSELDKTRSFSAGKARPKVYLEIYRGPLMSVSDKSFVGELIELAGGDNIFTELERDYSRVPTEAVISANPDIMICYSKDIRENIIKRFGWQDVPAIKNDRIYFESDINPDWLLRAGPRSVLGAKRLQEIIYED